MQTRCDTMPELRIRLSDGVYSFPLSTVPLTLGRSDLCDIVLREDAEVSREHARVWVDHAGQVFVEDIRSKNGTRVDDSDPFHSTVRRAFRSIRIGGHELEIVGAAGEADARNPGVVFMEDPPTQMGNTRFFPSSRKLDVSNQQRLSLLMSLAERIGGVFEKRQLLEQALDACCDALHFERGLIVLKSPRGETELPITRNVQKDEMGAYKVSRTLINKALVDGERAVVNNPATDLANNLTESLVRFPICSALCVPILHRDEILGVMYGDRITQASTYTAEDVDFLAAIAQQVGVGLANLRLLEEHVRAQKMYAELDQARTIQARLLPATPLLCGSYRIEGFNEPSTEVSGDYFDYFALGDDKIGVIIADVTGHGMPAALLMTNFQAAVHVALTASIPLGELAARLNRLVCQNTDASVFITAIVGRLDLRTGVFEQVSAGHPGPIAIGPQCATPLQDYESNCLPFGIIYDTTFTTSQLKLNEHTAALLFYTDGMSEARAPSGEMLGLDPIVRKLAALDDLRAPVLIPTARSVIREHVCGEKLADDLTLLSIQTTA